MYNTYILLVLTQFNFCTVGFPIDLSQRSNFFMLMQSCLHSNWEKKWFVSFTDLVPRDQRSASPCSSTRPLRPGWRRCRDRCRRTWWRGSACAGCRTPNTWSARRSWSPRPGSSCLVGLGIFVPVLKLTRQCFELNWAIPCDILFTTGGEFFSGIEIDTAVLSWIEPSTHLSTTALQHTQSWKCFLFSVEFDTSVMRWI